MSALSDGAENGHNSMDINQQRGIQTRRHTKVCQLVLVCYVDLHFSHLADALIQSDLQLVSAYIFILAPRGKRTHNPGVASAMLYQLSYMCHPPPLPLQ
ncbi:hypothetical protein J4Q44_G00067520 [Coregonus suidteri]|uniref:Uncharacterized protein n=1 Tax=Coregonus suidteri TaxID=861788 RepID=A0AAN8LZT9_9TELE